MKSFFLWLIATLLSVMIWAVGNFLATTQGWLLEPIAPKGESKVFAQALNNKAVNEFKGNLAYALLGKGEVYTQEYFSIDREVDENTRFGVASLSKWVTAVGVFALVEKGLLDLDAPVSTYLTRWELPPSEFDNQQVTLRRLLSHTAGITDGLGHNGFAPGEPVQPLTAHLTQAADADPGKSGKVRVGLQPGTTWMYSGGSYNLIQLIIEEVTGKDFAEVMQDEVFLPLRMTDTSFEVNRKAKNVAQYFGENQIERVYPNYTSLAATGLYTTINDLITFVRAQIPAGSTEVSSPRLLTDASLAEMREPLAEVDGLEIWGAGVMLFAPNNQGDYVIGHGGQSPYLNSSVRLDPATGDAFLAVQTGNEEALASNLATEWTSWLTGNPDMYVLNNTIPDMFERIVIGTGVILLISVLVGGNRILQYRKQRAGKSHSDIAA